VRLCLLQTHYRQPLHLTDERFQAARELLAEIDAGLAVLAAANGGKPRVTDVPGWISVAKDSFRKAVYDDLNLAGALTAFSGLLEHLVQLSKDGRLGREDADAVAAALKEMDEVLSLLPAKG
jgi:cysteinyl-tRNA synthetase